MRRLLIAALAIGLGGALNDGAIAKPAASSATAGPVRVDKARIDRALANMVSSGRAAGVSALVWQDGAERYFGAAGLADREAGRPMARDTLVQVFSMTKPVTGVALMQLWEQGKFGLDDPVARYLPEFAEMKVQAGSGVRPARRPITIRDLMRHTAGLGYGSRPGPADDAFRAARPLALENDLAEASRKIGALPLLFDPGDQWSYSAAVDIQARLVEVLSGQAFEPYVKAHVLEPLRMTDAGWTQPSEKLARFAASYEAAPGGKLAREPDAGTRALNFGPRRMTMGGAGLAATLDDYMRFARMLLNGGSLDGARILKPSTVKLMATDHLDPRITERFFLPSKGSVGFGLDFAVRIAQPKDAAENRGAVGEFFWDGKESTLFWVDPANRLAVVFFTQKDPFDGTLHHDIREAVYGAGYLGPKGD